MTAKLTIRVGHGMRDAPRERLAEEPVGVSAMLVAPAAADARTGAGTIC
jgi:hypothetical protein